MTRKTQAERKKTPVIERYELEVLSFESRTLAGINRSLGDGCRYVSVDDPLYALRLDLDVTAKCLQPRRFEGDDCKVLMRCYEDKDWFSKRVSDVQHSDEYGNPKYTERGGGLVPVFDGPLGIGELWRRRKVDPWIASIFFPFLVVKEFQTALSRGLAPYIALRVQRTGRERLIQRVDFSTAGLFEE